MHRIAQTLYSQKTLHTSPLRASYGVSLVSILAKNNRVMKGFYCMSNALFMTSWLNKNIHDINNALSIQCTPGAPFTNMN